MRQATIRVVLADDHALIRTGLELLLGGTEDIEVVATAADGAAAIEMARLHRPDVVLMDLQMPEVDGVTATRTIMAEQLGVDVLVLTSFSDGERILAALDAGAVGYLLKDADPEDVLQGIRAVRRGESPIHPKAARRCPARGARRVGSRRADQSRAGGAAAGPRGAGEQGDRAAAQPSERTVKAHLASAYARIGVATRAEAAGWATRHGL